MQRSLAQWHIGGGPCPGYDHGGSAQRTVSGRKNCTQKLERHHRPAFAAAALEFWAAGAVRAGSKNVDANTEDAMLV